MLMLLLGLLLWPLRGLLLVLLAGAACWGCC